MKKSTLGIIIAIVCTGLLVAIILATRPKPAANANQSPTDQQQISAQTVAIHATRDDCWTIINNKVYDVTDYVKNHPGGNEILRACGKDATALFTTRRDGNERVGSGTSHSSSAKTTLDSFQIGVLAK